MSGTRTNILVIATDQQRADAIGAYPGSQALTPNLDALAADGERAGAPTACVHGCAGVWACLCAAGGLVLAAR